MRNPLVSANRPPCLSESAQRSRGKRHFRMHVSIQLGHFQMIDPLQLARPTASRTLAPWTAVHPLQTRIKGTCTLTLAQFLSPNTSPLFVCLSAVSVSVSHTHNSSVVDFSFSLLFYGVHLRNTRGVLFAECLTPHAKTLRRVCGRLFRATLCEQYSWERESAGVEMGVCERERERERESV